MNTWLGNSNFDNSALENFMSSDSALFGGIAGHLSTLTDNLNVNVDESPANGTGSVSLDGAVARKGSLAVTELGGVSSTYAKKAVFTVMERDEYSGSSDLTSYANYYTGLAGIQAGSMTSQSSTIYNSSYLSGEFTYTATGGGTGNGYYHWKVNDQGRTSGTLTLYFNDNAENIAVRIYDSGGNYFTLNIKVDGIKSSGGDTLSPSITDGTRMTDKNSASFDGLTWEWNDLTPVFANMGSGLDEQIWFFAVQRYETAQAALDALGTNLYPGTEGSSGLQPIGYSVGGELMRLSGTGYDFDSGTFDGAEPINGVSATGSGYYRFEFYPMNYAGYIGTPVVRLVKADVAVGEVEVVLNYSPEESGTFGRMWSAGDTNGDGSITFEEAGAYVGTDLTAKVSFAPNFSGNRVHVLGADGEDYIVYVSGGKITGIYGADGISAATGWTNADGVWSMAEGAAFGGVKVSVEIENGKVVLSATYTGLAKEVVEKVCDFRVYSNAEDKGALADSVNNVHSEWGSGVSLNIDLAAPAQAASGNDGFVIKNDKNTIPAGTDRKWYTDSNWTLDADMTVTGEYDTLYYATEYYKGNTTTAGNTGFSDGLKGYKDIYTASSLDLTGFTDEDEYSHKGDHTLHLNFGAIAGKAEQAGYYVVYIVVKDRAGNVSELGVFGVLADGHEYTISVEIDQATLAELGSSPYDLKQIVTDDEGNVQTKFRRGETIKFVPRLIDQSSHAGAYVPYKIKKYAETGNSVIPTAIYTHKDDDITSVFKKDGILANYAYARLIKDGSGLELDVDRNSVANLPIADGGQTKLVFSYRRVMSATYNQNVSYTGERITATVTELFTDGSPAQKPDGSAITAKPYTVKYPESFVGADGITHAGSYVVQILRQKSEFYVLSAQVTDNFLTVTPVALNVTASMNPTGGAFSFYFGDMTPANAESLLGLRYDITSGLVGQDERKEFDALHEANIAVSISNMQAGNYVGLGGHNVIVTLTAKDYTVTLTWGESGGSFNIVARPMSFTVQSPASVIYGNPMPAEYTVRLLKSAFDFDKAEGGLRLYQTAEQVKALIGYDVTADGDYYEFTLPASAFAAFKQNDAGLYNVGDYPIADFNQGSTSVNNRLALSVAKDSDGKVTVTTRTVYVSPTIPEETINVEDLSELDGRKFSIDATGNPDIGTYGITGNFILGDRQSEDIPATEYTYAIKGVLTDFASAHNDTGAGYAANNITIAFPENTSGWTFTVHIISAAGQFVITFKGADIFTVTYGKLFDAAAITANAGGGYYTVEYYTKDTDGNYTVKEEDLPDVTLVVTITAAGYNDDDLYANNAGNYNLTVRAEAQGAAEGVFYTYAYKTADGALPAYVTVETLQATVKVSAVTALSKEYGADNPAIDPKAFGFEFSSDNDLIGEFIKAKGKISVANIKAGWERLAKVGSDYKYDWSACTFTAGNETISSNNIRFTVVDDGVRFEITQKVLNINDLIANKGLTYTGSSKPYDGNSTATATLEFGSVGENSVIIDNDNVTLSYTAEYWDGTQTVSDISSDDGYHIIFYGIEISGNDAGNYKLEGGITVEGFAALVYVTDEKGYLINPNPIAILAEYFTVSKTYDGNVDVTDGEVRIAGLSLGKWVLQTGGSFAAAQAGETMANFVIVFPETEYPQAVLDGGRKIKDYYTFDEFNFSVEQSDEGGIKLICKNINATIDKKAIDLTDIVFNFTGEDMTKVYNGTAGFEVPFGFTDTFAGSVTGFAAESVGLSFAGRAKSADVGEYALIIDSIGLDDDVNYEIGRDLTAESAAAEINEGGKPFSITPKELRLDIVFEEASYSGQKGPKTYGTPVIRGLEHGETAVIQNDTATYEYVRLGEDGTYKLFPYVQTGEGYYDGATYLHDVLASFTITVGGGFDWNNYRLEVEYEQGTTEGEYSVSGLILEKAAVLNPADVTLNVTVGGDYITVTSKTYDATNAATITIGESAYRGEFYHDDIKHLDFTYTAKFASANAGSGIDVSVSELALIADEGFEYIADSYKIAADSSKSFTLQKAGTINKAPVRVQLNIPEKVYDGTRYVELSPGANIGTLLNAENGSTDWAVAGEKFAGNYSVQAIAAGYDNANVAADAGGYAKAGTVIGFELVNDLGGAVNYYIVDADKSIAEFKAYSEEALGDKLEGALAYIAGVYSDGGELRYIIRADEVTAAGVDGIDPVTTFTANYAEGMGAIEPATVSLSVVIVDKSAFSKSFDDTSALPDQPVYGTEGDAEGTYDFYIRLSDGGTGFSFEQSDFVIRLAGAEVGNQDIIFTINRTEIGNYIFNTDNSVTVPGGEITKGKLLSVTAASSSGGDITGIYGDVGLDHIVSYTYQGDGSNSVTLTVADGYAYVTVAEWQTLFGHAVVPDEVTARRYSYNEADGKWTQADDGTHIRITGTFGTPVLSTAGGTSFVDRDGVVTAAAGTYENAKLSVTSQSFNLNASSNIKVVISPRTLHIVVTNANEQGNFTADYFVGKLPKPVFAFLNENEVASLDNKNTVLGSVRGVFMDGDEPVADLNIDKDGNYVLAVSSTNGNYTVVLVDADGVSATHKLVITIPELDMTQYKVKTNLKRQYELGADGQGVALDKSDLLNATAVADDNNIINITWTDANGNKFDAPPSDVGTYKWALTVTKKIGGSQEDYIYEGEFNAEGEFTIEKRKITVSLKESVGFTYDDGKEHVITKDNLTAKDADGNADEFIALISNNITYLLNGTSCDDMTDAGGYTVVLEFVDSPNYELVNNVGTVYVKAKPITVKVDPASKVYDATNGINGNVGISFTAEGADASDFSVVYRSAGNVVSAITTPGIYTYTIVSKDPNYIVSGESTGNFNVQVSKVTYTKDDIDYVTITFGSPVAVNYYLNDTAVAQGSGYWNIVDANVQKLAGEDGGLVTNGIIRIEMSNNNGVVSTVPGGVTVTARIPAGVGSDFTLYRVTSSGGLEVVEDYTVANGVVTYTTDYISNLVFVGTAPVAGFPWWIIPIIAAALVLTLALAILIAVLVKLHRAPDPIPVEVTPIDSIMPEPPVPAPAAPVAPVIVEVPAADIAPTVYDAPAAVSKHKQPPIIGIR